MPDISSFALQYGNVKYARLAASPYDLIVTEGDPIPSGPAQPAISPAHVAALQAQGRTVVGYVDVSVTDDVRSYWDPAWTDDGTDTGELTEDAPSWLQGQPQNEFGYTVKYWDAAWQQIVIDQALYLVNHGYDGVFLDDVGRYFGLIGQPGQPGSAFLADAMIDLVDAVSDAIKAVNPDAYIVVNGDPYIGTWATGGTAGAEHQKFLAAIDAMLLENPVDQTMEDAITNIGGFADLLTLFSLGSEAEKTADAMHAYELGLVPYVSPSANYDALGAFVNPGTAGDDALAGGDGPNRLSGLDGNDTIAGHNGADTLSGNKGNDTLSGDAGADALNGGRGVDALDGGTGDDTFAYTIVADSTGTAFDTITGLNAASDSFDLWFAVGGVDATVASGRLSDASFSHDLRAAIRAPDLSANHAVLFTPDTGDHAGETFLIVDANGIAGYQNKADLVIRLDAATHLGDLGAGDFI